MYDPLQSTLTNAKDMEEFSSNNYDPFEDHPATATADEDFEDAVKNLVRKRPLVLVTVGKAGAGKSTLINNFLRLRGDKVAKSKASPEFGTKGIDYYEQEVHGIVVHIIDTPGLEAKHRSSKEEWEELATLSVLTDGKADVMLYCMKLTDRADDKDERIVKKLTRAFGKEIWRHTILVLTFGDAVLNHNDGDRDLLEGFTKEFERFLKKAGVSDVSVKSVVSTEFNKAPAKIRQPEIIGIPVGQRIKAPQNWTGLLFKEIIKKCKIDAIPTILVFQYIPPHWLACILKLIATAVGGTLFGLLTGAFFGFVAFAFAFVVGSGGGKEHLLEILAVCVLGIIVGVCLAGVGSERLVDELTGLAMIGRAQRRVRELKELKENEEH